MKKTKLFDSKSEPIPRIRPDLDVIPMNQNGDDYLYFHDMRGYAPENFALDRSAGPMLSLLDGRNSVNDLKSNLGNGVSTDQLLNYIQFLDEKRLLHSPCFKAFAEQKERDYEKSAVHRPVTPGGSYPSDPEELIAFLDDAFKKYRSSDEAPNNSKISGVQIKALYAPHIDPRVGMETYVESFRALQDLKPRRVVMLATSHYAGMHPDTYRNKPFIVSCKDFEMPLGTIPADQKAIEDLLENAAAMGLSNHDRAHRIEHSIELHLLFLSYIWKHDFSIIPILIGGFDELFYKQDGHIGRQVNAFSQQLRKQFGNDDETLFLISGDLAHVGKKFGDDRPAEKMREQVRYFDNQFLAAGESGSPPSMLKLMKEDLDPYRICGFPPLYTFLNVFPEKRGQIISYNRWDETDTESAVSFGSILY
jgi:AmmeMemoRadiSam system protein B